MDLLARRHNFGTNTTETAIRRGQVWMVESVVLRAFVTEITAGWMVREHHILK